MNLRPSPAILALISLVFACNDAADDPPTSDESMAQQQAAVLLASKPLGIGGAPGATGYGPSTGAGNAPTNGGSYGPSTGAGNAPTNGGSYGPSTGAGGSGAGR